MEEIFATRYNFLPKPAYLPIWKDIKSKKKKKDKRTLIEQLLDDGDKRARYMEFRDAYCKGVTMQINYYK